MQQNMMLPVLPAVWTEKAKKEAWAIPEPAASATALPLTAGVSPVKGPSL